MWRSAHETYLEERILSADPLELIDLLYQGAITTVGEARRHLAEGRILARARAISKACDILTELTTSLDRERGGEVGERLAQLYGYMHRRLLAANLRQEDQPLAEVGELLATLRDGWAGVRAQNRQTGMDAGAWMPGIAREAELAQSGSWSF